MTDEMNPTTGQDQAEQTPQADAKTAPPQAQPQAQEFVYRDEVPALLERAVELAFRRAQSYTDSSLAKVRGRLAALDDAVNALKAAGAEIPQETIERVRMSEAIRTLTGQSPQAAPEAPDAVLKQLLSAVSTGQEPATESGLDPVTELVWDIFEKEGMDVTVEDPEFASIKTDGTPAEFVLTTMRAIAAKKERLAGAQKQEKKPEAASPAPIGNAGLPTATAEGKDAYTRLEEFYSRK